MMDSDATIGRLHAEQAPMNRSRSATHPGKWKGLAVALAVVFIGYGGYRRYLHGQEAEKESRKRTEQSPSIPVVVAEAERGDLSIYFDGLGTVTALNTVTIRSRVDGQIIHIAFKEGQSVQKGDLLAEIDPRPFEVLLTQAQGQLARDEAALTNAKLDLQRYETVQNGAVSQQQRDVAIATVGQYEGAVKTDHGQVDSANLQLAYCRITAPISGRVGLRQVDEGNLVHANDPGGIVLITQHQPIAVLFSLPQESLPRIMQAQRENGTLKTEAYGRDLKNLLATGSLLAIDNQIDATTGTARFKAGFENSDDLLFPNQFVNIRMLVEVKKDMVLVPTVAVQMGPQKKSYVYIVKSDDTVEIRSIVSGAAEGGRVIIEHGVDAGERIVTDGLDKLQQGTKVSVRPQTRPVDAERS